MNNKPAEPEVGYVRLLRTNTHFRRLWAGQLISQTGDWFNSVALFTLLLNLTGSGEAVSFVLILKLLPAFFVGPLAGVVADRHNRKLIMIAADIVRGVLVLGFLLVRTPGQVWMAYALTAFQVVASTFFEPAKSAAVPRIVSRRELVSANALAGATWSVTLALGAALGGFVTDTFGRDSAFIIDAVSFFVSAAFIWAVPIPSPTVINKASERIGLGDLKDGAKYIKSNLKVLALMLVKPGWGLGGGVLLLLTVFGKQVFPIGRDGSTSIGVLYAARGVGAMLGPMLARLFTRESSRTMRAAISVAFFMSAAFYLLFAEAPALLLAALFVIGAHAGGSIQWVFSTTLLQLTVPDHFRGRVFAIELALTTLTMSLSTYLTGLGLDHMGLRERTLAACLGVTFLLPGLAWLAIQPKWNRRERAVVSASSSG